MLDVFVCNVAHFITKLILVNILAGVSLWPVRHLIKSAKFS